MGVTRGAKSPHFVQETDSFGGYSPTRKLTETALIHGISEFQARLVHGEIELGEACETERNERLSPGDSAIVIILLNGLLWALILIAFGRI
jgi:hypothetical protein